MSKSVDIISVVLFVQCEPFFLRVNSNTGVCALSVGGNYNSNANYGFFYFNANNTASNSNANLGSRHLVFCARVQTGPYRSVKILPIGHGLVGLSNDHEANKEGFLCPTEWDSSMTVCATRP